MSCFLHCESVRVRVPEPRSGLSDQAQIVTIFVVSGLVVVGYLIFLRRDLRVWESSGWESNPDDHPIVSTIAGAFVITFLGTGVALAVQLYQLTS